LDTRAKLVHAAEKLMLRGGYSATSVDDVIRTTALSKGSFYHFFESKEALGLAALEQYYADRVGRLAAGAYANEADPVRRAHGFLEHASRVAASLWKDGCLLANLSADGAGSSRAISTALRKRTDELRALVAGLLGPIAPPGMSAMELADEFLTCIEGAIVLARIYGDPGHLQRSVDRFRRGLGKASRRK